MKPSKDSGIDTGLAVSPAAPQADAQAHAKPAAQTVAQPDTARQLRTGHRNGDAHPLPDFYFVTCEHGGNRIPSRYRDFFRGHEDLLRTHRGYDPGALRIARELAQALDAPLLMSTISRLLIDLNRSPSHPELYSEATRAVPRDLREEIFRRYYRPYRLKAETSIAQAIADGARVIHLSCHSFTPELNGKPRHADVGLLYDPVRRAEAALCRRWQTALKAYAAALKTRLNYPYTGTADGFTVYLRQRFPPDRYLGIELEINQKHVRARTSHWRVVRHAIIEAFHAASPQEKPAANEHVPEAT